MGSDPRPLDSALAKVVQESSTATESIWSWRWEGDYRVSVSLIEQDKVEQAHRMMAIGLAGGEGRSLRIHKINGHWCLVSDSARWIG
jgi:hypothetical protein